MSEVAIARRYAQALYEQAAESGEVELVDADIALIRDGLSASRELVGFFESPIISRDKKSDVVRSLFSGKVCPLTLRFLLLLVEKRRENHFSRISDSYLELRDRQSGVVEVSARTALPLSENDVQQLVQSLEKMTGKGIRLISNVDESILGGIIIRVGDTVYNGSAKNQLATLRERLETGSTG